jgi:hypothetical protein
MVGLSQAQTRGFPVPPQDMGHITPLEFREKVLEWHRIARGFSVSDLEQDFNISLEDYQNQLILGYLKNQTKSYSAGSNFLTSVYYLSYSLAVYTTGVEGFAVFVGASYVWFLYNGFWSIANVVAERQYPVYQPNTGSYSHHIPNYNGPCQDVRFLPAQVEVAYDQDLVDTLSYLVDHLLIETTKSYSVLNVIGSGSVEEALLELSLKKAGLIAETEGDSIENQNLKGQNQHKPQPKAVCTAQPVIQQNQDETHLQVKLSTPDQRTIRDIQLPLSEAELDHDIDKVSYLLSGYAWEDYPKYVHRKAYREKVLGFRFGVGLALTSASESFQTPDLDWHHGDVVDKGYSGINMEFFYRTPTMQLEIGGIIPRTHGQLMTSMDFYFNDYIGWRGGFSWLVHRIKRDGQIIASAKSRSLELGLVGRIDSKIRYGIVLGVPLDGELEYRYLGLHNPSVPLKREWGITRSPLHLFLESEVNERWSLRVDAYNRSFNSKKIDDVYYQSYAEPFSRKLEFNSTALHLSGVYAFKI